MPGSQDLRWFLTLCLFFCLFFLEMHTIPPRFVLLNFRHFTEAEEATGTSCGWWGKCEK